MATLESRLAKLEGMIVTPGDHGRIVMVEVEKGIDPAVEESVIKAAVLEELGRPRQPDDMILLFMLDHTPIRSSIPSRSGVQG